MTGAALHAYVVVLNFGEGGPLHCNIWVAPDAATAAGLATVQLMQEVEVKTPLLSCIAAEIEPERLRHLLRAVEGKLPEGGNAEVLSLVPKEPEPRPCRHYPDYPNCTCDPVSCVMLRSAANPAGLELLSTGPWHDPTHDPAAKCPPSSP